jgi:hypothetical protein
MGTETYADIDEDELWFLLNRRRASTGKLMIDELVEKAANYKFVKGYTTKKRSPMPASVLVPFRKDLEGVLVDLFKKAADWLP